MVKIGVKFPLVRKHSEYSADKPFNPNNLLVRLHALVIGKAALIDPTHTSLSIRYDQAIVISTN